VLADYTHQWTYKNYEVGENIYYLQREWNKTQKPEQ